MKNNFPKTKVKRKKRYQDDFLKRVDTITGQPDFEKLCLMQCTLKEISAWYDVNDEDIIRWVEKYYNESFSSVFERFKSRGVISLRRSYWQRACDNNPNADQLKKHAMDNYGGTSQKVEKRIDHTNSDGSMQKGMADMSIKERAEILEKQLTEGE